MALIRHVVLLPRHGAGFEGSGSNNSMREAMFNVGGRTNTLNAGSNIHRQIAVMQWEAGPALRPHILLSDIR